ncbi:MAG: sodium:solute symporter, partial [Bacteroidetes bacterium]|nr:sodium:solute symporter [Bacteroidota bacterium]
MSQLDWIVLAGTLLTIVAYGTWKTYGATTMDNYMLGGRSMKWWTIGLSIMATQASAITFLSTPGQAFDDGMRFIQFYFGLPLAIIVISEVFLPIYHRLRVYTAYEFLETRFDLRIRVFTACLFLLQRGLAAGFTIFAPSLILSSILGWNIIWTNILVGSLVITYTMLGGTKAVSLTQKQQMAVIFTGMFVAGYYVIALLPEQVSFLDAIKVAGKSGKLNAIDLSFDWENKYNIWTGLIGGTFLALSYFGTDQSQVQRYLGGESVKQSRLGLVFNALLKIPLQFSILFIGVMVYVFYLFNAPPMTFNKVIEDNVRGTRYETQYNELGDIYQLEFENRKEAALSMVEAFEERSQQSILESQLKMMASEKKMRMIKEEAMAVIRTADEEADTKDINYVFLRFVLDNLPAGLIGLVLAVIFSASMSSTSSELNALATT